jgi:hypothetical protein
MRDMRIEFEMDAATYNRRHSDSRQCSLESIKDAKEVGSYAEVVAVCTCGRRKEFFATEVYKHIFICNGGVILRYHKDSAKTF